MMINRFRHTTHSPDSSHSYYRSFWVESLILLMRYIKECRVIGIPIGRGSGLHFFYIKEHRDNKIDENKIGKVLFVGNIDYGVNRSLEDIDSYLRHIFEIFGDISTISVSSFDYSDESDSSIDTRARFAHVIFVQKSSLKSAMKAEDGVYQQRGLEVSLKWGEASRRMAFNEEVVNQYKWVGANVEELRQDVDDYMREFEEAEESEKQLLDKKAKEGDDDGFVLVANRKKRKRVVVNRDIDSMGETGMKKSKKEKELKNFYRFQMREEKQNKLVDLRKKFEEDKCRVAQMKANRNFKPF